MKIKKKKKFPQVPKVEEDDEDLEALRIAALRTVGAKSKAEIPRIRQPALLPEPVQTWADYQPCPTYDNQRRDWHRYFRNDRQPRQNGVRKDNNKFVWKNPMFDRERRAKYNRCTSLQNAYHPSRVNKNLIEIIPMEQDKGTTAIASNASTVKQMKIENESAQISKYDRYKDEESASEEEDTKESCSGRPTIATPKCERLERNESDYSANELETDEQSNLASDGPFVGATDDDDDDDENSNDSTPHSPSSSRTVDEEVDCDVLVMHDVEEENSLDRLIAEMENDVKCDITEKDEKKLSAEKQETNERKESSATKKSGPHSDICGDKNGAMVSTAIPSSNKNESRSISPRPVQKSLRKRQRSLSPKPQQWNKSPTRRSPRRSPRRIPLPPKKGPRESPRARSPPRRGSPPGSRFDMRERSPKIFEPSRRSPMRRNSPRERSPKVFESSRRSPIRRNSPRDRSPKAFEQRRSPRGRASTRPISRSGSPRHTKIVRSRSPRQSPVRISPRGRSPPERRRRSPIDCARKRKRTPTPVKLDDTTTTTPTTTTTSRTIKRGEASPVRKQSSSPDTAIQSADPILEARRRKFENVKLIDPINDNKKIKITKKEDIAKKMDLEEQETIDEEYSELCLTDDYLFDAFEVENIESDEESPPNPVPVLVVPVVERIEKDKTKKKNKHKKRSKELYKIGKNLRGELPLSVRINERKIEKGAPGDEGDDLRVEISRRRAEKLNRGTRIDSAQARLLQTAVKGVVNEYVNVFLFFTFSPFSRYNNIFLRFFTELRRKMPRPDINRNERIQSQDESLYSHAQYQQQQQPYPILMVSPTQDNI